jgi:hypothetical protein
VFLCCKAKKNKKSTCTRIRYSQWGKPEALDVLDVKQRRYNLAKAILKGE